MDADKARPCIKRFDETLGSERCSGFCRLVFCWRVGYGLLMIKRLFAGIELGVNAMSGDNKPNANER